MRLCSDVRPTSSLINLTEKTINLYDETTGYIHSFPPCNRELPTTPAQNGHGPIPAVHYIVNEETFNHIANTRKTLEDIAIVCGQSAGRGGICISYLVWGENPKIQIRLYADTSVIAIA